MKFSMYYGFTDNVLKMGIEKASEIASQLGFSSVEMFADLVSGETNNIEDVQTAIRARKVLEQYKLPLCCYSVYVNLWRNPDGEKKLIKQVEIAAELGSPYFHHTLLPWLTFSGSRPSYQQALEEIVEVAVRIAAYADSLGVTCIYEDQGYYVNGVEGFRGFWDEMNKHCNNIGICGDLGNILFVNEKPEDFLKAYAQDICHVHIKDYLWKKTDFAPGKYWLRTKDGSWVRDTMIGDGVVDFEACLKLLKRIGYKGYFALENSHPEPYEEGVYQAMEYLQRFW